MCTILKYTIYSKHNIQTLQLKTTVLLITVDVNYISLSSFKKKISQTIKDYISHDNGCLGEKFLTTPVFINVILLPGCPPGLTLTYDHTTCSCYSVLTNNGFRCSIQNKTGYLNWNSTVWVNATFNESTSNGIIYNHFCPLQYRNKTVKIGDDPSKQCELVSCVVPAWRTLA